MSFLKQAGDGARCNNTGGGVKVQSKVSAFVSQYVVPSVYFQCQCINLLIMTLSVHVQVVPSQSKGGHSMDSTQMQSNVSVI